MVSGRYGVENQARLPSAGAQGCWAPFTRVLAGGMLFVAANSSQSPAPDNRQNMPVEEREADIIPTAARSITPGQYTASLDIALQ